MRKGTMLKFVLLVVGFVSLTIILGMSRLTAVANVLIDPNPPANAPDWSDEVLVSTETQNAFLPHITLSSVDDQVLIVYPLQLNNQPSSTDPYYVLSPDKGENWSPVPQPIYTSSGVPSIQVNAAFGPDGQAHVVWVEGLSLAYSRQDNWGSVPQLLSIIADGAGATDAVISVSGENVIDVVWSEAKGVGVSFDVKHTRSIDGGETWWTDASTIANTAVREDRPALVVDPSDSNKLHVVYEAGASNQRTIYYTQGTVQGNSATWTAPVQISPMDSNDREPDLLVNGSRISVVYTHIDTFDTEDFQLVYYVSCHQNCTEAAGWAGTTNISGPYLTVNETLPFYITTTFAEVYGCKFAYYHGVNTDYSPNERIYGVNSCAGWNGGGIETVTLAGDRAINPQVAADDAGWLYMVYELYNEADGLTQIQFIRGEIPLPGLYLPVVLK